jgi:hypothetical protein
MGIALVTGASSGIGLEMAKILDSMGHRVVLVARSAPALEALAASLTDAMVVVADLGTPDGPSKVIAAVPDVDIVINNAGFGECGPVATSDAGRLLEMIQVNCSALTALTAAYLPAMLERGSGHILNVASTAGFQPGPTMAVYYATKAYVLSFTEAVAEEARGSGVGVTAFCPGAFTSGFQATAHAENTRLVKGRKLPTSQDMASAAIRAMERNKVVAIPGLANKLGALSPRISPRSLVRRVAGYIQAEAP